MIGTKFAKRKQNMRGATKPGSRGVTLFSKICNDLLEKNPQGKK